MTAIPALEVTALPVKEICALPCLKTLRRRPILLRCVRTLLMIPLFVGGLRLTLQDHYKRVLFFGQYQITSAGSGLNNRFERFTSFKPPALPEVYDWDSVILRRVELTFDMG